MHHGSGTAVDMGGTDELDDALRRAIDAAPDGIIVVAATGEIVFANPMACDTFGYKADELVGTSVDELLPADLRGGHDAHRGSFAAHPRARPMGSGLDLRARRKSGSEFPVEISLTPVQANSQSYVVAIVRDVTDRRRAAEELMAAHEELALVGDRERIARDLHDTVIQRLFAVGLSLQAALTSAVDPATAERIERAIEEIDGTIRDVRSSVFSLQTRRAATAGPRDDVLLLAREAARALGFDPHVVFEGLVDAEMPPNVHEQLLPTLREALSNIAKHAEASSASVLVSVHDDEVSLVVVDNGVGVPTGSDTAGGSGLRNMQERAAALGGTCAVRPKDERGTVIEWRVPLR